MIPRIKRKQQLDRETSSFSLTRVFSFAGLASVCVTAVMLTFLYRNLAITTVVEFGEENNIIVAQTAFNSVKSQLVQFLEQRSGIRANEEFDATLPMELQASIRETMRDTSVVRIKIYNQNGIVLFSTKPSQLGHDTHENPGFQEALAGRPQSRLVYGDTFNIWDEEEEDDNLIQTYIPVREDLWTPVLGVFEIYTDVAPLVAKTERMQILVLAGVSATLVLLYGFLLYIVHRGDRLIRSQKETILNRTGTLELLSARMLTAEETERRRIAERLHEGVAQTLSAIKLQIETAHVHNGTAGSARQDKLFDAAIKGVQQAIRDVRAMAIEIHPPSLHDIGLLETIGSTCREFESIYPQVSVETDFSIAEQEIPSPLKTVVFRIVQEILTHIGKQANADTVRVAMRSANGQIRLSVEDNGLAYHSAAETERIAETGMASTRERTVLSGGAFAMSSNHRGGTLYEAVWTT